MSIPGVGGRAINIAHRPKRTNAVNLARRVDLFTRQLDRDRISQQLNPTAFDPSQSAQRCDDTVLFGNDSIPPHIALVAPLVRDARQFGFAEVEPHQDVAWARRAPRCHGGCALRSRRHTTGRRCELRSAQPGEGQVARNAQHGGAARAESGSNAASRRPLTLSGCHTSSAAPAPT